MQRFLIGLFLVLSMPIFAMDEIEEYELAEGITLNKKLDSDCILDSLDLSIALMVHQDRMPKNKQHYLNKASVKKSVKKNRDQEFSFFEKIGAYSALLNDLMKRFKD